MHDDPALVLVDARQRRLRCVRLRCQPASEPNDVSDRRFALDLIDRRPPHFAVDGHRETYRRNENDIALQKLAIVGRVAADQKIVQIELPHDRPLTLQLDIAQRADHLGAPGGVQRGSDRPQAADRVGTRPLRFAQHKHPDRAGIAHGDAGTHADHLPLNP